MYKIKIDNFEGPFDLLLYFIKRDELNIYDIPIAKITQEFLEYIRLMQMLDLELAGEFIVMSSTLMQIKSQMLLPREVDEDGEMIDDPRTELVQKLLEYKQIKDGTGSLREKEDSTKYTYYRENFDFENTLAKSSNEGVNVGLFDLIGAVNRILQRRGKEEIKHKVDLKRYTIEEQSAFLKRELNIKPKLSFKKLLAKADRGKVIATFLAILDLVRNQAIYIIQNNNFDDITITKVQNLN